MLAIVLALLTANSPAESPADASPADASPAKVRIAILGLRNDGADVNAVAQVVDALALRLSKHARAEVLTTTEIQAVLGFEAAKQTLECEDGACAALDEITRGLDVRYIVAGSIAPRGSRLSVHLSLVDVQKGTPVVRTAVDVDRDDLDDGLAPAASELLVAMFGDAPASGPGSAATSTGLPVLSWVGIGVAALGAVAAGVGVALYVADDGTLRSPDKPFAEKEAARGRYVIDQAIVGSGIGVVVIGAALATAGFVLQE